MDVDANQVIAKLLEQIRQMSLNLVIKDCQIESLQIENSEMKNKLVTNAESK